MLLPTLLFAGASFITPMEYASQLYKNPRGIGCHKCHGESGEGKLVAKYIDKTLPQSFSGPRINHISYEKFYMALNRRLKLMPRYFLTDEEIEMLYFYLQQKAHDVKK